MNLDNFKVILCPTLESTKEFTPEATVEAEYGDVCIEGTKVTLAHHGSRSGNPAPCNTEVEPLEGGIILVSHLDLDSIGGIMAIAGDKIEDLEFWQAAEYIDVNGPHHVHEFSQDIQDKLNAVWAWNATQERVRYEEPTDVTSQVADNYGMLEAVLDENHPQHNEMIEKGREWEKTTTQAVESKLVGDYKHMRVFETDGLFCSGSYYSPGMNRVVPATVVHNEKTGAITVAFADGGERLSAKNIVQQLWGPEAGGRDGIAGSPRGQRMSPYHFEQAQYAVQSMSKMKELVETMQDEIRNMPASELFENYITQAYENWSNLEFADDPVAFSLIIDKNMIEQAVEQAKQEGNGVLSSETYINAVIGMQVNIRVPDMELFVSEEENQTTIQYMFSPEEREIFINACEERESYFNAYEAPTPEKFGYPSYFWEIDDYTPVADNQEDNQKAFEVLIELSNNPITERLLDMEFLKDSSKLINDVKDNSYNFNADYAVVLAQLKNRTEGMALASAWAGTGFVYNTPHEAKAATAVVNKIIKESGLNDYTEHLGQESISQNFNKLCYKAIIQVAKEVQPENDTLTFALLSSMKDNIRFAAVEYKPDVDYVHMLNEVYWKFRGANDAIIWENGQNYSCKDDEIKNNIELAIAIIYGSLKENNVLTSVLGPYRNEELEELYKLYKENNPSQQEECLDYNNDEEEIGDD